MRFVVVWNTDINKDPPNDATCEWIKCAVYTYECNVYLAFGGKKQIDGWK